MGIAPPPTKGKEYGLSGWDLCELLPQPTEEKISERLASLEQRVQAFVVQREQLNP